MNMKGHENSYLFQRQINLQSRENQRKMEYERIQKENLKFSQRLINAKSFLNRYEQQISFDKHCQLKQRLQRYPNLNQTKKTKLLSNDNLKIINKPTETPLFIYNDIELPHDINKSQVIQKKLPHCIKYNSRLSNILPSITTTNKNTEYVAPFFSNST